MVASAVFLQSATSNANSTEYTFASQNLGTADADRYIVVGAFGGVSGGSLVSMTINGVSATIVGQASNTSVSAICIAKVPNGTSGNIVVTWSGVSGRCGIAAWIVSGVGSVSAFDVQTSIANTPSVLLDIPADGIGIAFGATNTGDAANTTTWIGLTEDGTDYAEDRALSFASDEFASLQTGLTVELAFGSAVQCSMVAASFAAAATNTVTLADVRRVNQRDGSNEAALPLSGTYSGATSDAVEARLLLASDDSVVVDWADVDASLSAGTWSGAITVPAGPHPYYVQVRLVDSGNAQLATAGDSATLVCGDVIGVTGQSNARGSGANNQVYTGTATAWMAQENNTISDLNDPWSNNSSATDGSFGPLLANLLDAHLSGGYAIVFIVTANGGQAITAWDRPSGGMWLQLSGQASAIDPSSVLVYLWLQGESEAATGGTSEYEADESALADAIAAEFNGAPKLMSCLINNVNTATAANIKAIHQAKLNNWAASGNVIPGPNPINISLGDNTHYSSDAQLAQLAGQWFFKLADLLYGGSYGRGPRVVSIISSGDEFCTVQFDRDLDAGDTTYGAGAWSVDNDDGTARTIVAVTRSGTRQVLVECSGALDGTAPKLTFGNPAGNATSGGTVIPKTTAFSLPETINTISSEPLYAEPFYDQPITTGPSLSSATVNAAGATLTLVFDEAVTTDYTGLDVDGYTLSNWAGSGTDTLTATITQVYSDEAPALDYVSATGNLTGVVSGVELADLTGSAITNSSSVSPNPTLTTGAATSIGTATASVPGTVTSEGRESVTERGVVWATTTAPDIADTKATAGTGAGAFVASLTGLPDNTLIYFRAYATNASGTSYGSEDTFTTLDDPNPTINSIRFSDGGTRIRIAFSEAVTGTTGFSVDSGTITYVSGSGSAVYLFSFTGTPTTVSYTPGNVVDSISQALGASGPTAIDPEPTSDIVDFIVLRLF